MDGKEKVLKEFDFYSAQKQHWKIYYDHEVLPGKLVASTEVLANDLDKSVSRKMLVDRLEMLPQGEYLIQFKPTADATKNIINCRFTIGYSDTTTKQSGNPQTPAMKGYIDPDTHERILKSELARKDSEWQSKMLLKEMQNVRDEMKEMRLNPVKSPVLGDVKEIIGMVKGMMAEDTTTPVKPAVMHGPKVPSDQAARGAYFKKLYDQAISEMFSSEGEGQAGSESGVILLWCLNEWRKANPQQYAAIRPEILKLAAKLNDGTNTNQE